MPVGTIPIDTEPTQDLGDHLQYITRDASSRGNQCELIVQSPTLQARKMLVQLGAELKHTFEGMVCQSRTAQANQLELVPIDSPEAVQPNDLRKTVSMIHPDFDARSQNAISNQILSRSMNPDCKQFLVRNRGTFFATVAIHFGVTAGRPRLAGIHDLFVEANSRKQAYGSQILHTAIDHIHRESQTTSVCAVFADKSASPFYLKHGFETVCRFQRWLIKPQP
jgi:predicted GNAT family N-acyltransferase